MNIGFKKKGGVVGMPEDLSAETESTYLGKAPKTIQWIIKYSGGLIKTKKQAQYILLIFSALAIIFSLFLVLGGGAVEVEKNIDPISGEEIIPGQIYDEI